MDRDTIPRIFISYAEEDRKSAERLYSELKENSSTKLWIDKKNLLVGVEWKSAIRKAIKRADYFIALLSKSATRKFGFVQKEIRDAIKKRKRLPKDHVFILPVRLEECRSSFEEFEELHHIDLFPKWEIGFQLLLKVFSSSHDYLGRIDRAELVISKINRAIENCTKYRQPMTIRMRATWTSMSNIKHYEGKEIVGLPTGRAQELDQLLIDERKAIIRLLDFDFVELRCICSPKIKYLSDSSYWQKEKDKRVRRFVGFLKESLGKHIVRRELLYDRAGAYGNQLFIGDEVVITADPESGGYTKTFFSENRQLIDIFTREYDSLFQRIKEDKLKRLFGSDVEQKRLLLYENLLALGRDQ